MPVSQRAMDHLLQAIRQEIETNGVDSIALNVQTIAQRAGYRERCARYALHELEQRKMIVVQRSQPGQPSVYSLVQ